MENRWNNLAEDLLDEEEVPVHLVPARRSKLKTVLLFAAGCSVLALGWLIA